MKKFNFFLGAIALLFSSNIAVKALSPVVDSISITVYADLRDTTDLVGYDPDVMYLTGHWTPPTAPGAGDWTFIMMDKVAENIFKATFKYAPGQFAGNTGDDPDLLADNPGWYFAPTNDWSTAEHVPAPCNVAWDVQRIFQIDVTKKDTTVAFKYGVCAVEALCDLGIPSLCVSAIKTVVASEGTIFPNPASDMITLKSTARVNNIKIIDLTGKTIQQLKANGLSEISFSVKDLPSQLYFVQYEGANGKLNTTKLLKR